MPPLPFQHGTWKLAPPVRLPLQLRRLGSRSSLAPALSRSDFSRGNSHH